MKKTAKWFIARVPEVGPGVQAYYWAWVARNDFAPVREPEIVLVEGAKEECDRRIFSPKRNGGADPGSFKSLPENVVLWKGPLNP
jgi:hypothetical protein